MFWEALVTDQAEVGAADKAAKQILHRKQRERGFPCEREMISGHQIRVLVPGVWLKVRSI